MSFWILYPVLFSVALSPLAWWHVVEQRRLGVVGYVLAFCLAHLSVAAAAYLAK